MERKTFYVRGICGQQSTNATVYKRGGSTVYKRVIQFFTDQKLTIMDTHFLRKNVILHKDLCKMVRDTHCINKQLSFYVQDLANACLSFPWIQTLLLRAVLEFPNFKSSWPQCIIIFSQTALFLYEIFSSVSYWNACIYTQNDNWWQKFQTLKKKKRWGEVKLEVFRFPQKCVRKVLKENRRKFLCLHYV